MKHRFLALSILLCACLARTLESRSFKNDRFEFTYGDNTFCWNNKLKLEGFYSKNITLLNNGNGDLDKTIIPGKFTLDSAFYHTQYDPECDWDRLRVKAEVRFKGTFGAPESSFRTGFATIKDLDAVGSPHAHPINVHIPVLRELWLEVLLNDLLGLSFDHEHYFTVGLFPFSLGRGISLGDAFAVTPDFIGYDPASSVEQYAPGFKFSGSLYDDHVLDYDAYAAILDNLSDSFSVVNKEIQGQFYGHRFNQARGFGVINYVVAGRLKWTPVNEECHKVYFEPYALFNDERDQKLEVSGDATSKLGTFGLAGEFVANNWEFGFDVAHNVGEQCVKGLDRNVVVKQLRSGVTAVTGPDTAVGSFVNSHAIASDGSNVPFVPGSDTQNAIEEPIERASACDKLNSLNDQIIEGAILENNNEGIVELFTVKNAKDRFRDPYTNKFSGFMAVGDAAYHVSPDFKIAGTVGYASGDENPNKDLNELGESEIDGDYTGFISLQELYSGKRVRSAFLLSGKGKIPRVLSFPVNRDDADIDPPKSLFPSTVSRFTNIAFVGAALWWHVETCSRIWDINPNILTFWQTHATKLPIGITPVIDGCDPCVSQREPRECARRHLGTELNIYIDGTMSPGLKIFFVSGVFIPGSHFDDIKGRPLNKAEQKFLASLNNTGETTKRVPVLGNDPAFFLNAGIEYRF